MPEDIDFGAWYGACAFLMEIAKGVFQLFKIMFTSGGAAAGDELIIKFAAVFFI